MRKYYRLVVISVLLLSAACKENTLIFPESVKQELLEGEERKLVKPDYVQVLAEYDGGNIQFIWPNIDKEEIKAITISFVNEGEEEVIEVVDFSTPMVLEKMKIGQQYDFSITAIGTNDEQSKPFLISATPKAIGYELVASSVMIVAGDKQLEVSWLNSTKLTMKIDLEIGGEPFSTDSSSTSGSITIPMVRGNYDIKVTVKDSQGRSAAPIVENVTILEAVEFDRSGWGVSVSNELSPYFASTLIDGDVNTFWHTDYFDASLNYPYWVTFDMLNAVVVNRISMAARQDNAAGMTKFKLEGSINGTEWIMLLDNQAFDPANIDFQDFPFTPQSFRYLRMTAVEGVSSYTHLAEIRIFGLN